MAVDTSKCTILTGLSKSDLDAFIESYLLWNNTQRNNIP